MPRDNWQAQFASALLVPDAPIPDGLYGPDTAAIRKRFAVYRNNVVAGLLDALSETFPAARRIVGADFFAAMARIYVALDPPRSPLLLAYGGGFADFIDKFEPASGLPYLGDVCRIERAWLEAYHAPETTTLDPLRLQAISPSQIPGLRLTFHPSVRLISSRFPALTIWRANIGDSSPVPVDLEGGGENALISRPEANVEVRDLSGGAFAFVREIASHATILQSTEIALNCDPEFALEDTLAAMIKANLIVGYVGGRDLSEEETRR